MPLSQTTRASLQSTSDNQGVLEMLVVDHSSFATPLRMVNDTRDWVIDGVTFIALPFSLKLPSSVQKESPRAQLQLDNVGREMTAMFEALPVGAALVATIRLASRATPSVIDYEFVAQLSGISVTPTMVTCTISDDDTMRQSAVKVRYDPRTAPGLFAG